MKASSNKASHGTAALNVTKPNDVANPITGLFVMLSAIIGVVAVATIVDVQISLRAIDPDDPATWPNMAPQVRYYFIPVLATILGVVVLIVHFGLQLTRRLYFRRLIHWLALGAGYGTVSFTLPLFRTGLHPLPALLIACLAAILVTIWLRRKYGVPSN